MADTKPENELTATYVSPTGRNVFASPLSSVDQANRTTADKTAYLSDLRAKVSQLQNDVNAFLTDKMEEDKAAQEASGATKTADEAKQEDMYGEEDPEDDA